MHICKDRPLIASHSSLLSLRKFIISVAFVTHFAAMSQQPGQDDNGQISSELESFRQQWCAEVKARTTVPGRADRSGHGNASSRPQTVAESSVHRRPPPLPAIGGGAPSAPLALLSSGKKPVAQDGDDDLVQPLSFDEPLAPAKGRDGEDAASGLQEEQQELSSALEHFEKAVEKEELGSLGDSLRLYRKAFRVRMIRFP